MEGKNADLAHQNELLAARLAQLDLMLATTVDNPDKDGAKEAATRKTDQDCVMTDTEDMKHNEGLQRLAEKEDAKLSAEKEAAKSIEIQDRPTPKSGSAVDSTLTPKQIMEDDGAMAQD